MYNIPHFKSHSEGEVLAFMKAHPFVLICGVNALQQPVVTHVPVLIDEREGKLFLRAHVMRKQEHTLAFEHNPNVLVVFSGAHAYISASWYQPQNVAGTWNYQAVHANGKLRFLGENDLLRVLTDLTDYFEGSENSVAAVKNMDPQYIKNNTKAIVAFEIEITQMQHVFKLSQNKDEITFHNIISHLQNGSWQEKAVAAEMLKNSTNK